MKKTLKISWWILVVLIILFGGAYFTLRSSTVQTKLTQYIASYFAEKLGTIVSVRGVDIGFLNSVILEGVYIEDLHRDTLIFAEKLKVNITGVSIEKHHLQISRLTLDELKFYLRKYPEDDGKFNLQFLLDAFAKKDTVKTASAPWTFAVNSLILSQTAFQYDDQRKERKPFGMDYSHLNVNHINLNLSEISIQGDTIKAMFNQLSCVEQSGFVLQELSGNATVSSVLLKVDDLKIITPSSKIFTQLEFNYSRWGDFLDYVNKVNMNLDLTESTVSFYDIAYFASALNGMTTTIDVTGKITGPVRNLKGKNLDIHFLSLIHI